MHTRIFHQFLFLMLMSSVFFSCKKKDHTKPDTQNPPGDTTILTSVEEDSLKYLMYNIMQVSFVDGGRNSAYDLPTYYWYQQVPDFQPFSSQYATAEDLLSAMTSYPQWNGKKVDRYSFLDRTGNVANQIQNGVIDGVFSGLGSKGDFGMEVSFAKDSRGHIALQVLYADKNSPAGLKGIRRGWQIIAVNGNDNMTYDGPEGKNVNRIFNAIYDATEVSLTFLKPDQTTVTYSLSLITYDVNPILFDTVYVRNDRKIGYLVFYTFSSTEDDKGAPTQTKEILDKEFLKLKSAGIQDLIVDLRYNGGGAVTTAAYLDNAIASATTSGKIMYQYIYNDKLSKRADMLGLRPNVKFNGTGGLNLDNLFFIVSNYTASASELTINNLKPYMNVKMVGDTTYGKPVGFIDFTISTYDSTGKEKHLADLYAINFETKNAAGEGGYFNGIAPDTKAEDYIDIPWGDPSDDNLSKIFHYISTGNFARASSFARLRQQNNYTRMAAPKSHSSLRFNGMVDYRLSRQIKLSTKKGYQ